MTKQQLVLEVSKGYFAAPKLVLRHTEDLYSAEKFWSLEEAVAFAKEYNYPNAKIRVVKIHYELCDEFTLEEAEERCRSIFE